MRYIFFERSYGGICGPHGTKMKLLYDQKITEKMFTKEYKAGKNSYAYHGVYQSSGCYYDIKITESLREWMKKQGIKVKYVKDFQYRAEMYENVGLEIPDKHCKAFERKWNIESGPNHQDEI